MAEAGVKFIRVHGRVVPIRDKSGASAGAAREKTKAPAKVAGAALDSSARKTYRDTYAVERKRQATFGQRVGYVSHAAVLGGAASFLLGGRFEKGVMIGAGVGAAAHVLRGGRQSSEDAHLKALKAYRARLGNR